MAAAWLTTSSAAAKHLQAFVLSFMAAQPPAAQRESILALLSCIGQPGMRPGRPLMLPLLLAAVAATQPQALQRLPAFQGQVLSMLQQRCADLSQGTTAAERSEACQGTAGRAHACPLSLALSVVCQSHVQRVALPLDKHRRRLCAPDLQASHCCLACRVCEAGPADCAAF